MTEAERRIVAFLLASDATTPADLPDWLLALLEGDDPEELSHELITAASLLYARRLRPGISVDVPMLVLRRSSRSCSINPVAAIFATA